MILLDYKRLHKKILSSYQPSFRFDQWPVGAVHLVVEATGVTQIMAVAVSSPERGGRGSAVHTLTAL